MRRASVITLLAAGVCIASLDLVEPPGVAGTSARAADAHRSTAPEADGWRARRAKVRRVRTGDAPVGRSALLVTPGKRAARFFAAVGARKALSGRQRPGRHVAEAYVRAARPSSLGKPIRLDLTLRATDGRTRRAWTKTAKLTAGFQRISVRTGRLHGRASLSVRVGQGAAAPVDGFLVDAVRVTRLTPPPAGVPSQSMTENASFELGTRSWSAKRAAIASRELRDAPGGRRAAVATARGDDEFGIREAIAPVLASGAPRTFLAVAQARAASVRSIGKTATIRIIAHDARRRPLGAWETSATLGATFRRISVRSPTLPVGSRVSLELVQAPGARGQRFAADLVSLTPFPPRSGRARSRSPELAPLPDSGPPRLGPAPTDVPSGQGTRFDGWLLGLPAGTVFAHGGPAGPYGRADIAPGASVETRDGGALAAGTSYVRFDTPPGAERAELSEAQFMDFDPAGSTAIGETAYLAFAFRYPRAPENGGWGHLILQAKSRVSNLHRIPPQIALIDDGGGLALRTIGGDWRSRAGHSVRLPGIETGRWYTGVLGVHFASNRRGWAMVWLSEAGDPLPPEFEPTAALVGVPTTYLDPAKTDADVAPPNFFRIGLYHDVGYGSVALDTVGFSREPAFESARRRFQP